MPRQRRTSQPAQGHSGGASQSEQQRAPDWNPLAKLSTHRSGGWKKDLDCYMGAYFRLNYRHVWRGDCRLTPGGGLRYRAPPGIFSDAQAFGHHSTVAQENRRDMEISLRDLHKERDLLQNEIELLARARDNEQRRETKKTLKKQLDTSRRNLHSNQELISRLEELLGLGQSREPPTGQGRLDVIVEETTETTMVTADEAESGATPPGGLTRDANAPEREMEQDMETEGPGSPVTPTRTTC